MLVSSNCIMLSYVIIKNTLSSMMECVSHVLDNILHIRRLEGSGLSNPDITKELVRNI